MVATTVYLSASLDSHSMMTLAASLRWVQKLMAWSNLWQPSPMDCHLNVVERFVNLVILQAMPSGVALLTPARDTHGGMVKGEDQTK